MPAPSFDLSQQREATHEPRADFPFIVASTPPDTGQRRVVAAAIGLLAIGAAFLMSFGSVQGPQIDVFLPVLQTVICVADLITATLLFVQYSIQSHRAILVLASGYVCSGVFAFLQTLAFPGAYAPTGLFGNADHAAWFFVLWQTTFPSAIIVYALWKDKRDSSAGLNIGMAVACVVAAIIVLSLLVTTGVEYLPTLYTGGITVQTPAAKFVNILMLLIGITALAILFSRWRSILDLWLIVTLIAWMPNFIVAAMLTTVRFSVGWYMARGYALVASCTVLTVLLTETTFLYARLVDSVVLLRRERANRLMSLDAATSAMAHELKQPLMAISASGEAALLWSQKSPVDLERVRKCITAMLSGAYRADEFISGVRELFKKRKEHRTAIQFDDVAREAIDLMRPDLQANGIFIETEFKDHLPAIYADRVQLQQVILNLIRNAIEAMNATHEAKRLRLATRYDERSAVILSVEDSGRGMAAADVERAFVPFFTTKSGGMGLGLAICQAIIEGHAGILRIVKADAAGCVFEVEMPVANDAPRDEIKISAAGDDVRSPA